MNSTMFIQLLGVLCCINYGVCMIQFLGLGDWGDEQTGTQQMVADGMDAFCETQQCDFVVTLGDNFYHGSIESPNDSRFDTVWRDVYDGDNIGNLSWYISVGNHDFSDGTEDELNQVAFSESESRWVFPWLWHDHYFTVEDDIKLHLIIFDSTSLLEGKHNLTAQTEWLETTLRNSEGDYVIVVAHHPSYSTGMHGGNRVNRVFLDHLFDIHNVDVFLTGHDHDLQHLRAYDRLTHPTDHVISGAGSRKPYHYSALNERLINRAGFYSEYFGSLNGFTAVKLDAEKMTITHYMVEEDDAGHNVPVPVYVITRDKVRTIGGPACQEGDEGCEGKTPVSMVLGVSIFFGVLIFVAVLGLCIYTKWSRGADHEELTN